MRVSIQISLIILFVSLLTDAVSQSSLVLFNLSTVKDTLHVEGATVLARNIVGNAVFHSEQKKIVFCQKALNVFEIKALDFSSNLETTLHTTELPVSSIAITPDQQHVSFIVTSANATSLMKVSFKGGEASPIMTTTFLTYAWVDDNSLIGLEAGNPNVLKLLTIRPKKETVVAQNVGAALHRFYTTPSVTFIHKQSFDFSTVKRIGAKDGRIAIITDIAAEQEIFTWTPSEVLISTDGKNLFSFDPKKDQDWKQVKFDGVGNGQITNLAVNASGDKLIVTTSP
jgi:hypothetical protein